MSGLQRLRVLSLGELEFCYHTRGASQLGGTLPDADLMPPQLEVLDISGCPVIGEEAGRWVFIG